MKVKTIQRDEFLEDYWRYKAGQHVSFIAPTGAGKTYLAQQLLKKTSTPELPAIVLVAKPKDETVTEWNKTAGYRKVKSWPPTPSIWAPRKPKGFILWPSHTFDPDYDNARLWLQFRRALLDSYKRGKRIIFADEVHALSDELKLQDELKTLWSRGRSMGTGLWGATQRPAQVPLLMYGSAEHLFLAYDPDKRSIDRFREIGGVDPILVKDAVMALDKYQWLYIRRTDRVMCVVDK